MKPIFFWFIILLVAGGCRKGIISASNMNGTEVFPNRVGDRWSYLVSDTTVRRGSTDSPAVQYNMTVTVVDSVQLSGGIRANIWVYTHPGGTDTNYVFQTGDTMHFIDVNQTVYSVYSRQYVISMAVHSTWQYSVPSYHDVTVESQSDIIVGQNYFSNAFHIHGLAGMPDAGYAIDEWFKNNVGIVKRYFNPSGMSIDPRHVTSWSLVSYHLQ